MNLLKSTFLALACMSSLHSGVAAFSVLESQIEGHSTDNFHDAQFRLWTPQTTSTPTQNPEPKTPNSILCFISGSGMNALGLADDPGWQKLATNLNAHLLMAHFRDSGSRKAWHQAEAGSGQALLDALKDLSLQSRSPGLAKLPIFFVGLSTGGQYAYHWASWKPEQTGCFITLKGGMHREVLQPQILGIPSLWVTADGDMAFRQKNIKTVFARHKEAGAHWTLAVEPKAGHESENASRLIQPYLFMVNKTADIQKRETFRQVSTATLRDDVRSGRDARAPSEDDFLKLLRDFEEGKSLEAWPQLAMNSKALPEYANVSPASLDFGTCESGQGSASMEIQVSAHEKSPGWDRVELADPDKLWEVVEAKGSSSPKMFRMNLKPLPELPLGLFKTSARFRFYQGKTLLLGGMNVPALVRISGDVEAKPRSLYLGVLSNSQSVVKELTLKSRSGRTPVWMGAVSELPKEIQIKPLTSADGSLVLKCIFLPELPMESASGILRLKFKTDREWVIQIPYMGSKP